MKSYNQKLTEMKKSLTSISLDCPPVLAYFFEADQKLNDTRTLDVKKRPEETNISLGLLHTMFLQNMIDIMKSALENENHPDFLIDEVNSRGGKDSLKKLFKAYKNGVGLFMSIDEADSDRDGYRKMKIMFTNNTERKASLNWSYIAYMKKDTQKATRGNETK